jgi:hypothetical protein
MDYNHITNFFDKFKKLLSKGEANHALIADIVSRHITSSIKASAIKIKDSVIYIKGSPMLKSEILIHKQAILTEIELYLVGQHFTDIR